MGGFISKNYLNYPSGQQGTGAIEFDCVTLYFVKDTIQTSRKGVTSMYISEP